MGIRLFECVSMTYVAETSQKTFFLKFMRSI